MNKTPNSLRTVSIIGTGVYLPEKTVTNRDLEKIVDTTDEWIYSRTGMHERRIARADVAAFMLDELERGDNVGHALAIAY